MLNPEVERTRKSQYEINPLIINRRSPRSMTGENLNDSELMSLFEVARWGPSSFNGQLWRFIYARRNTEHWDRLFNLLAEGNKVWTKNFYFNIISTSSSISSAPFSFMVNLVSEYG